MWTGAEEEAAKKHSEHGGKHTWHDPHAPPTHQSELKLPTTAMGDAKAVATGGKLSHKL